MIDTIGAEYIDSIEDAHMATHVIATDGVVALRRTPKLMICICTTPQILSIEWLEQCAQSQRILDTNPFLVSDKESEKKYDFTIKETIRRGIVVRRKSGGVLGGLYIYICNGVAGNRAPSEKEMHLIIEAAGGHVLKSLLKCDPLKTIVITSDPSTKAQLKERGVSRVQNIGSKVLSTTWLFHTIITQKLFDIDDDNEDEDDEEEQDEGEYAKEEDLAEEETGPLTSRLVRCNSNESLTSTISVLSTASPVKRGAPRNAAGHQDDDSVRSNFTRGSRVSHLERATHMPSSNTSKRRKLASKPPPQPSDEKCLHLSTRDHFFSSYQNTMSSDEPIQSSEDAAAAQTHGLWLNYFNEVGKTQQPNASTKALTKRKSRGRSQSSVLTTPAGGTEAIHGKVSNRGLRSTTARILALEDNPFVTWEANVLFTLVARAEKLGSHQSLAADKVMSASSYFPCPVSISNDASSSDNKKLSLNVDARPSSADNSVSYEVFGTLQDVFNLHKQYQTVGTIPEKVIAMLSLQAIEAVAAMHSCGIVHNDIGLASFVVVRLVTTGKKKKRRKKGEDDVNDSWFLQLTGFGYKSVVLNCEERCQEGHYEHDYACLGNVIHLLLMGGVELTLNDSSNDSVEFASTPFISGNLFLRGAMSWCSLIDSLLCAGELASTRNKKDFPFQLQYPILNIGTSDNNSGNDSRMNLLNSSVNMLKELSENDNGIIINEFMDGLCKHNSRFIFPDINLQTFQYTAHDDRPSFTCHTSNVRSVPHVNNLQADTLALAKREAELQEKIARFEQSKAEQQSILQRESTLRLKENELVRREQAHALEVQHLEKAEGDLLQREQELEQRRLSSPKPPTNDESGGDALLAENDNGGKRKKPSTPSSQSQLSAGEEPNPSQRNKDEPSISPKRPDETKEEDDTDSEASPDLLDSDSDNEDDNNLETQDDYKPETQVNSQESESSAKKRRRGRQSVDPLQSLPRSPHLKPEAPKAKPKKVMINFDS